MPRPSKYNTRSDAGARLMAWRTSRGISRSLLARWLGVTNTAVWNWENGKNEIANQTIIERALQLWDMTRDKQF